MRNVSEGSDVILLYFPVDRNGPTLCNSADIIIATTTNRTGTGQTRILTDMRAMRIIM
jgi:hypothetical protein